jgi:hypothetical protein
MHEWWDKWPDQKFRLEATDREDIGADLRAPQLDESGKDNWRYTLFMGAKPGNIVLHYDSRSEPNGIVGWSVIAGVPRAEPITWGARGSYAQRPVYVRGCGMATALAPSTFPPDDFWREPMCKAAAASFHAAGASHDDISALMIYDNFTPTVLFSLEGFGYCGEGESGPFAAEGHLALGARYPANTSGGHLSESYMQGWALNLEAVLQIRGTCGARQVKDCAFVHYMAAAPVVTSIIYARDLS